MNPELAKDFIGVASHALFDFPNYQCGMGCGMGTGNREVRNMPGDWSGVRGMGSDYRHPLQGLHEMRCVW